MNILFYGGHYWSEGPWFRKQRFAQRLYERGHKIFYIENSVSCLRKSKNIENDFFKLKIEHINNNLKLIKPSTYLPFPSHPLSNYLYQLKFFFELKKIINDYFRNEYILWFNNINFSIFLNQFNADYKIFDLCDDIPLYSLLAGNKKQYRYKMMYLKKALRNSDLTLVSSHGLKEKYQKVTKNEIILAPNGHQVDIKFHRNYKIPHDLLGMKNPIIGFIGTLFRFIDQDLLQYIIKNRSNYNYVFIGKCEQSFNLKEILKYKNVLYLGEKEKSLIPSYINHFDICINPFRVHKVNDSVNPLKVYEYLAHNKKVVSTCMYSLKKEKTISKYIDFAKDQFEFLRLLDIIINNKDYENFVKKEDIQKYHWDSIFINIIKQIQARTGILL